MSRTRVGLLEIEGLKELQAKMRSFMDMGDMKSLGRHLYNEGWGVMRPSKRLVPVDWGNLKGTGNVSYPEITFRGIEVEIGYGDTAVDYAIYVHENLRSRHEVGQAKYLEQPFYQRLPGIQRRLGVEVMAILKKDIG